MSNLKGTKTEINLLTAFAGESQARNRYTYAASVAKKAGLMQISDIFQETADQEKEHAKRLFKFLEGGDVEITAKFPAGKIASTLENLEMAISGEHYEQSEMYPAFAQIATAEGFPEIAKVFTSIAIAERQHEKRYRALAKNITNDQVFKKSSPLVWRCRNCGYIHEDATAPNCCPACTHPQGYFEVLAENW